METLCRTAVEGTNGAEVCGTASCLPQNRVRWMLRLLLQLTSQLAHQTLTVGNLTTIVRISLDRSRYSPSRGVEEGVNCWVDTAR